MSSDLRVIAVPEGLAGERVDAGVARLLGLSRTHVAELAARGGVRLDGEVVGKSARLVSGSLLEVEIAPRVKELVDAATPVEGMRIAYDDDDVVVVDKPVGVAAHASVGWEGPTVLGGLRAAGYRITTSGAPERRGIVQRLDVGTSGLMMVAKSELAYTVLKQAFRDRAVDKIYHAVVQGMPDPHIGTIDAPIGRHPAYDYRYAVMASGKPAVTHYDLIEAMRHASLLRVKLETGRTHQIRVHFSAVGHPLVGDPFYGCDPVLAARLGLERQWLHAMQLGFIHPRTGERVTVTSSYPADLNHALELLREDT